MYLKKLLALLLSAALALSLLAGCGGESVARSLLALLDGKYANVSVEMDPDLEADLRQAIRTAESENAGDDAAVIRAALETLLGSKVTFRKLGEGQQGDTAFDLIFYAGADPDKAAQSAYSQWNGTFSNLPDDGLYTAALAQVQTENGVWLLVQATVDKAGTVDKPDKDDNDDEPEKPYSVEIKDGTLKSVTVNTDEGFQYVLFGGSASEDEEEKALAAARDSGFAGVTIELAAGSYSVKDTFGDENTPFMGTLKGEDKETTIIKLTDDCNGLFKQIESNGKVENITFDVQKAITDTYAAGVSRCAGAVAGQNNGTIQNCDVTINAGGSIQATSIGISAAAAGGLVGLNDGTIQNCDVTINAGGSITANGTSDVYAGGIVGTNESGHEISGCKVTINGGSITAANDIDGNVYAGGIAGENRSTISNCHVNGGDAAPGATDSADISTAANVTMATCAGGIAGYNQGTVDADCSVSCCKIEAGDYGEPIIAAGGIVGWNKNGDVACGPAKDYYITATAGDVASATAPNDEDLPTDSGQMAPVYAGAKIGYDEDAYGPIGE